MKKVKKLGVVLAVAMSMTMLAGCGKTKQKDVINKYADMCVLGDYKGIEYHPLVAEVDVADIQYEVMQLMASVAAEQPIESGTVESGDVVTISFDGTIDGVAFEGGSTQGQTTELELGSGRMIPGFEEGIMGHEVGESFTIDVTFPNDYYNEELAGKDAQFAITIASAVRKIMPEYNDEFVAANTEYKTVEEYEASIRESLETQYKENMDSYNKSNITTTVVANAEIKEYPEKEMQEMLDETMENVKTEAEAYGYSIPDYIKARYGVSTEEEFRQNISDMIKEFMNEKIVLCAIAKAENISVSDDEIKAYKQEMMESGGFPDEKTFDSVYSDEDVMYYTLADKVVNYLYEQAVPVDAVETSTTTDAE
ncbi:MAG: trigger factor [Lachnospiraceae bacterium]|nr:trigger factor [Lachnospiraceae bacterium]